MDLIINVICAILSTISFSIFFSVPKRAIFYCSLVGTIGWVSYYILKLHFFGNATSNFIAAIIIGLLAEYFSYKLKMPSTVFLYIGIVMIVPGYSMYNTMEYFARKNYSLSLNSGVNTVVHACSIAIGVLFSSVFSKSIKRVKSDRMNRINEMDATDSIKK